MNKLIKVILVGYLLLLLSAFCYAEYPFGKIRPIEYKQEELNKKEYISHNYGEYRSPTYFHDGMDYQAGNFSVSIKRW
ncbi:MAG: hypothetical protein WCW67_08235 [Candidatus Margulisiibacteriota bacterium]|jgi:hypothetical protein